MEIRVEAAYQREIIEARHPLLQEPSCMNNIRLELTLWLDCFRSQDWKRTHISVGLMFFQQFIGINVLAYHVPILFGALGADHDMQLLIPGVLGAVNFLGTLSCLWTIDIIGRRRLLIYGSGFMLACLLVIMALNSQFSNYWTSHLDAGWVCVPFSILCILAFGATWSPVTWALSSELFPSTSRAKGAALTACSFWG